MAENIIVITASHKKFEQYCRERGYIPHGQRCIHAREPHDLYGYSADMHELVILDLPRSDKFHFGQWVDAMIGGGWRKRSDYFG